MSFSYLKNKFKKKKEGEAGGGAEDNREIIKIDELEVEEPAPQKSPEEEEMLNQVMTRINEIENDIPRIKVSMDTLKSQIGELREEIERLDKTIKDVMVLYEVVSQEINPFKEVDGANPLVAEIQELGGKIDDLKSEIAKIKADLRLLVIDGIDLDELIYETISEGGA
ncbi:flagella accessory protein C [Thermococcus sp.]|uniref:flagella accessory protein C n=1 Tax=Thermococcus sp. TaxID=35749 RepID=UPI0026034620|nr:flagella accessory protein C [Thermococcus sp.]